MTWWFDVALVPSGSRKSILIYKYYWSVRTLIHIVYLNNNSVSPAKRTTPSKGIPSCSVSPMVSWRMGCISIFRTRLYIPRNELAQPQCDLYSRKSGSVNQTEWRSWIVLCLGIRAYINIVNNKTIDLCLVSVSNIIILH